MYASDKSDVEHETLRLAAIVKGSERYVFLFQAKRAQEALAIAGRWARDPQLSFSYRDLAKLAIGISKGSYIG